MPRESARNTYQQAEVGVSQGPQGIPIDYANMTNAYVDPHLYYAQCAPFTLYKMVSNLELSYCTSKDKNALPLRRLMYLASANYAQIVL